ncbi:SAFB-like transcription modulator isoform X1 [Diorhabda carinulata]|uniref:SAFB-like transcription modulator isoform X1 n=1 Tax=Diorhabda carinulata TaxID=1163345 RepID=UPI0025A1B459|nr:SAFB-like transcription modulator isoform X1 [Diorhabda carinulata]XP_057660244.1 SAFB-like transcription modulator isoform X1 [Diorhabda carinulata]
MSDNDSKKLSGLRVIDLKIELEKRGLDKNGTKQVLVERLSKAISDEGFDPETYVFDDSEKKKDSTRVSTGNDEKSDKCDEVGRKSEAVKSNDGDAGNKKDLEHERPESPIRLTLDDEEAINEVESETSDRSKETIGKDEDKKNDDDSSQPTEQGEKNAVANGETKDGEKSGSAENSKTSEKLQKKVGIKSNPNVVWISNVAQNTRASELKAALSACGKVTGAKVVVNARFPGSCCFGYVTMSSVEDVENVIAKLNNTELKGQIIKIEKFDLVRAEQMKQMKAEQTRESRSRKRSRSKSKADGKEKKEEKKKDNENKEGTGEGKPEGKEKGRSRNTSSTRPDSDRMRSKDRRKSSKEKDRRPAHSGSKGRHERDVLTFDKIREERERQRLREKERQLREELRRRQEEASRQREIERRQHMEARRLEREKEKLRMEREKIEREKVELVRMERERQRLEREKLAIEKLELERTLIRLDEERRAVKRPAPYRRDDFDDRKRSASDRHYNEAPPPPSIKQRDSSPKKFVNSPKGRPPYDTKRDLSYPEKRGRDYDMSRAAPIGRPNSGPSQGGRPYDGRDARSDIRGRELPSRPKDVRYDDRERGGRDRSPHFRQERRPMGDGKLDIQMPSRDAGPRSFDNRSGGAAGPWQNQIPKPFGTTNSPKFFEKEPWRPNPGQDRWQQPGRPFSGNSNLGPACPPPPGLNNYPEPRFNSNMRKY